MLRHPMAVLRDKTSARTRFLVWLVPKVFYWLSQLLFRSCRLRFVGKEHEDVYLRAGVVMVSASRDGDLIAHTMARFGLRSARGSSKRGGADALRAMIDEVNA